MAQIKHVKDLPVVDAAGAKFFVLKNGQMSQTDLSAIIEKVKNFDPSNINTSFEKAEKLIASLSDKITVIEKKLEKVEKELADVTAKQVVTTVAQVETTETVETAESSDDTTKKSKKTKKTVE